MSIPIAPETTIADLLQAYPHLEEVLLRQSPHFAHLKNPILRRTVARIATLEKAAQMGGIPLPHLITTLRQAAGLATEASGAELGSDDRPEVGGPAPDWLDEAKVCVTLDADQLLAAGEVPLPRVHQALGRLVPGEPLCVASSFHPAPLIEVLAKAGHRTYVRQISAQAFRTYVVPAR